MDTPEKLAPLLDRPVAILGNGVSGRAAAALLRAQGKWCVIYDERGDGDVRVDFTEKDAARHGLVVASPGFAAEHRWLSVAQTAGCTVLGELDFASLHWGGSNIAVTGTNGKTTVTEFLAFALKRAGHKAIAVGNTGYPMSRLFELSNHEGAMAVCEVSSYQAELIQHFHPQSLIWTNFDEDHLDRYPSLEAYFLAKWRLVEQLGRPSLVVGESVMHFAKEFGKELPPFTRVVSRSDEELAPPSGTPFTTYPQQENYRLVRAFWEKEGLSLSALEEAARQFTLPHHRLQLVGDHAGLEYWNDSKATNFASALAALRAFDVPIVWIGGGKSKGGDLIAFAQSVAERVQAAVLIGKTAEALKGQLAGKVPTVCCSDMAEAVQAATAVAKAPSIVLLSPGFSSQDLYENYTQRGFAFEQAVLSLKKQAAVDKKSACEKTGEHVS